MVEGYCDRNNKVKQRILKSYGYLSDLESKDPNVLEKLREEAKLRTSKQTQDSEQIVFLNLNEKRDGSQNILNYGYIFLESIYNELNITSFIKDYSNSYSFNYDLNDILKLLVFSRALKPSSKKKTFNSKGNYFFELKDFNLDNIYRSLDHLSLMKDNLMIHLNNELIKKEKRDVSLVF